MVYITPFCWSTKYPSQCLEKLSSFCGKIFSFVKSALCSFQACFVLSFWAITLSGGGIALAYINLFAFDISNNYDSALLKLEVLLTVNCLQTIFICFYLFKDCVTERAEEAFPSGSHAVWGCCCWAGGTGSSSALPASSNQEQPPKPPDLCQSLECFSQESYSWNYFLSSCFSLARARISITPNFLAI